MDINLIWFGYIASLSQWGGVEYLNRSNDFYVPSLCCASRRGGGQHTVITPRPLQRTNNEQILQYENLNNQAPESAPKSLETNDRNNIGLQVCPPVAITIRIGRVFLQKRKYSARGPHFLCCRLYLGTTLPSPQLSQHIPNLSLSLSTLCSM